MDRPNDSGRAVPRTGWNHPFRSKWLRAVIICVLNCLLGVYLLERPHFATWDIPNFYFASELALSGRISQIYNQEAYKPYVKSFRAANPDADGVSWVYYNRPAFEVILFSPLSFLSYHHAQRAFIWINCLLLQLLVWKLPQWFPSPRFVRILLLIFGPFLMSIWLGQDTLLLTLMVGYGLYLAMKQKDAAAGVIIAMAGFKPHLIFLLPVVFLVARRWRLLKSFVMTACALGVISFSMVGLNGIRQWIQLLQAPTTDIRPALMGNLRALAMNLGAPTAILAGMVACGAFGVILWRESFTRKFSAALLLALLLSPHTYNQDYSIAAVAGLAAFPPAALFIFLLPWTYVVGSQNTMIPMILLNVACLVMIALECPAVESWKILVKPWRSRKQISIHTTGVTRS